MALGGFDDGDGDDAWPAEDHVGDAGVDRAPICGACGVTALPAETSNVLDSAFVCDNEGCEAYGEIVG